MDRILRLGQAGLGAQSANADAAMVDTAEQVYISSLALLKMLKHGRAGVPMEVMGLMLGEFVDEYTGEVDICQLYPFENSGLTKVSLSEGDRCVRHAPIWNWSFRRSS